MPRNYLRHKEFTPHNKIIWTDDQLHFMRENFNLLTNGELATKLGLKITSVRLKLYEMGLYKMRLQYWTEEQKTFLKQNYQLLGDTELAEIFTQNWDKEKGWSKKHIEKKRRYLFLKRTKAEIKAIHQRNVDNGCFAMCSINMWKTRGVSPEGSIRFWRLSESERTVPFIKINGTYVHWSRWFWEQANGPIPEGMFVSYVGETNILTIENLKLITAGEHRRKLNQAAINLSDGYIAGMLTNNKPELRKLVKQNPELINAKRNLLLLERKINHYGQKQTNRS